MQHRPPRSILIVDDEASVIHALRRCLRKENCEILHASGPHEALKVLNDTPTDLVISDHLMGDMTGLAFLKLVRDRHPDCVRMLLTGQADMQTAIAAINHGGIYRFLTKPWDDMELRVTVNLAFDHLKRERENRLLMARARNPALQNKMARVELSRPLPPPHLPSIIRDADGAILLPAEPDSELAPA
ncbi:hypothetical protein KH5H1_60930 [Corallococcus caeni]|uniref:response regulator n=1 Tax=Corallococcus caeni TaxID=3082388 RepID=UPI002957175B|nr:hypothetical protein KH5H1_60930 [Corallococcus sp. KH5-1]